MAETTTPRTFTEREEQTIERVRQDLLSGRTFALAEMSARSHRGYEPPITRRQYAHAMRTIANMAEQSDSLAQIAVELRINLYGTDSQATASLYRHAFTTLAKGYDDVIGRAAPDAGRRSSYQHDYSLQTRITLAYWLAEADVPFAHHVPSVGWCVEELARREQVLLHGHHTWTRIRPWFAEKVEAGR